MGQKSGVLRKMQAGSWGAPLTHGAGGSSVHCHLEQDLCVRISTLASPLGLFGSAQHPAALLHSLAAHPPHSLSAPRLASVVTEPGAVQNQQWLVATEPALSSTCRCFLWSST